MSTLTGKSFSGDNGYTGLWIGSDTEPFSNTSGSLRKDLFRLLPKDNDLPTSLLVADNTPALSGAITTDLGNSTPVGVAVTITDPNGNVLNSASTPEAQGTAIGLNPDGSLAWFSITNPTPGTWTVTMSVDSTASDESDASYQLFMSTLPDDDAINTVDQTLEQAFGDVTDSARQTVIDAYELGGWQCVVCTIGAWALAAAVIAALAVAAVLLSVESAVVLALAAFASVAASSALAFIMSLASVVAFGIDIVLANICKWAGACS